MKYYYILSDSTDPYHNLAMEQSLFPYADEETVILFLWQNDNTIVIGRNQDPYIECKVDEFLATGGKIARRRSGGGAVYHDLGNLNFSIITLEAAAKRDEYQRLVAKALSSFGLIAEYNGRNDLLVQGRKFSGNAFYTDGSVLCQHGTVLIATDLEKMTYFLTPNPEKLARNGVGSVKSRVVNLGDLTNNISVEMMQQALISILEAKPLDYKKKDKELDKLMEFYKNTRWVFKG